MGLTAREEGIAVCARARGSRHVQDEAGLAPSEAPLPALSPSRHACCCPGAPAQPAHLSEELDAMEEGEERDAWLHRALRGGSLVPGGCTARMLALLHQLSPLHDTF